MFMTLVWAIWLVMQHPSSDPATQDLCQGLEPPCNPRNDWRVMLEKYKREATRREVMKRVDPS
jgi:hypothetical protein